MKLVLLGLCLAGCLEAADSRFQVVESTPESGTTVAVDAELSLTFSEPHDVEACGESSVHLLRIGTDGHVGSWLNHRVRQDTVTSVTVQHDGLESGSTYWLSVQTGSLGCRSAYGEGIRPFAATFEVQ